MQSDSDLNYRKSIRHVSQSLEYKHLSLHLNSFASFRLAPRSKRRFEPNSESLFAALVDWNLNGVALLSSGINYYLVIGPFNYIFNSFNCVHCLKYTIGFVTFFFPGLAVELRKFVLPYHQLFGLLLFLTASVTGFENRFPPLLTFNLY